MKTTNGYITLLSVLIVGAVGVVLSTSLLLIGLDFSRTSLAFQQSNQAKALANACTERALNNLRLSLTYAGGETLNFGQGFCQVVGVLGSGNANRTIEAIGNVENMIRKVKVVLAEVRPRILIVSWQEVADF